MIDDIIVDAIEPLVPEIAPDVYEGAATTYCTYSYSTLPALNTGKGPSAIIYLVSVHLYLPRGQQSFRLRQQMCNALRFAGCTYPTVLNLSDKLGQHFAFECQAKDGEV